MDGRKPEVEMFPIQFTVFKHTSFAPQAKQGFGWNTISNMLYSLIGMLIAVLFPVYVHFLIIKALVQVDNQWVEPLPLTAQRIP